MVPFIMEVPTSLRGLEGSERGLSVNGEGG
jgi:hypothetical protein